MATRTQFESRAAGDQNRLDAHLSRSTASSTFNRSAVLWGLLVLVVVSWTAREVIDFDFVAWDDEYNILLNPHLGPPTADNVAWMFTDLSYMRRYVPFGWLAFSVAYEISGLSPVAYHVGNLLFHVLNALLLYFVIAWALRRWHPAPKESWIAPCAAAGALFWALHPLRAETIGWASGMLYSLACVFALLSVLAYLRGLTVGPGGGSRMWRWTALGLYAISLLTYPITLGLIVVFLAIDTAEWRRTAALGAAGNTKPSTLLVGKLPFVIVAVAAAGITLFGRLTANSFWGNAPTLSELPLTARVMRGFYTLAYYPWRTSWPANLSPFPAPLRDFAPFAPVAIMSVVVVLGCTYFLWRRRKRGYGALLLRMLRSAFVPHVRPHRK